MPSEAFASFKSAFLLFFENPWRCTCIVLVHSAHVYYIPQINLFGSTLEGKVELRTSPDNLSEELTPSFAWTWNLWLTGVTRHAFSGKLITGVIRIGFLQGEQATAVPRNRDNLSD